jgi:hypothetical protein
MNDNMEERENLEWHTRLASYRTPPPMPQGRIWNAVRSAEPRVTLPAKGRFISLALAASLALFAAGSAFGYMIGRNVAPENDARPATAQISRDLLAITWF